MIESDRFFEIMADELVQFSEFDSELKDALKWIDETAQKKGITFYDRLFEIIYKHDINSKAKDWLNAKQNHPTVTKN